MRLIDADLIMTTIKVTPQFDDVYELFEGLIKHFPIAFDVDKVCKRLSENRDMDNLIDVDHAIKIVNSALNQ